MTTPQPLFDLDVDAPDPYDKQFWSVTTILKVLASPALEYWAIKETATAAVDSDATIKAMLDDQGRDETIKWMCGARWRKPKIALSAADLGTIVHRLCEMTALDENAKIPTDEEITQLVRSHAAKTVNIPAEVALVKQMLGHFLRWCDRFQPEYTAAEAAVYSEKYGYAGCLDAILTIGGQKLITDYKTRREPLTSRGGPQRPYAETALQLSAYRHADMVAVWRARRTEIYKRRYYLLSPDERQVAEPVPADIDSGLCIIITPESCEAYPMLCDEQVFDHFLYVLESFRWEDDLSRRVVGDALEV
jgi:hypothetical protein